MRFGELVRKHRKEKKLSVYDVAKHVGISHSYITQIENGKRNSPNLEITSKIAAFLNIPAEDIINLKISEYESSIKFNRDNLTISPPSVYDTIIYKLRLLPDDKLTRVEGYLDCLLEVCDKNS